MNDFEAITERCEKGHKFKVRQLEGDVAYEVISCPFCGNDIPIDD